MIDIQHPYLLLLLLPLCWAAIVVGRRRLARLPWLRALVTLGLRLAITTLLVLALAGPRVTEAAGGLQVVFVLDRSASVGAGGRTTADAWIRAALKGRHADDSASIVSFGKAPAWSGVFAGASLPTTPPVEATGSDIEAAIRLGLTSLQPNRPGRLVLLSDGRQTVGDAALAAQQAALSRVPVSVVPIAAPPRGDVAVAVAELPASTRGGEHMTLRVGLQADRATTARISLSVDGAPLGGKTLALRAGLNTFFFAQTAGSLGLHIYHVQVAAPGDPVPQNNALDATTIVGAAPRVLVLAGDAGEAAPFASTLAGAGLQVTVLNAKKARVSAASLGAFDAVVLADVPASDLTPASIRALGAAVHDRGMGLLVAGGPRSYAVGGYAGSGLEPLLPVTSLAVAHAGRGNVGLILIIDKSGSMMDSVQGVSKISMAQQAAIEAISHLQPTDSYGVISYDDNTSITVPFGPVGNAAKRARSRASIMALQAFGNTVIYPALRQAARYLFASKAPFKHIVLMTDGQGETNAPFIKLIKQMKTNNITLSTIAIGSDAEIDELQSWAATGGGRYYFTADPHDIPRLVVLETRISSGPTRVQGTLAIHQAANDPALRSLVGSKLPYLHAYNIAAPKDNAQVLLQSQLGDPVLTQWRYGLGSVTAWTGGITADWAQSWLAQSAFWSDVMHGMLPAASRQALQASAVVTDSGLRIGADAITPHGDFANLITTRAVVTGPGGPPTTVDMPQDAPGHYSVTLPNPVPGVYDVHVAQYDNSTILHQAESAVAVPYSAEYSVGAADLAVLRAVAAAGNAPALAKPADAFSAAGLPTYQQRQDIWPWLALLALLLFPLDVAGRVLYTPPIPYDPAKIGVEARKNRNPGIHPGE